MPLNYFNDLEDQVQGVLDALNESLPKANSELTDAVLELFYQLDKDPGGTIKASVANLKRIDAFKSKINQILSNGSYSDAVTDYVKGFSEGSSILNDYFGTIVNTFQANDDLYSAILDSNVNSTIDSLLGKGVQSNFTDAFTDVLRNSITSGTSKKDFIDTINANLDPDSGILSRYVNQTASDAITQFNSHYITTVSNDLGLKYYFYKGTKIQDTRPFCSKLIGKYLTEDQLKEYVQQQMSLNGGKGWAGMYKGENWGNFMIYRGGYNCRHYVIPVSKEIYDAAPQQSKWVG
jgi:hypothetical protein